MSRTRAVVVGLWSLAGLAVGLYYYLHPSSEAPVTRVPATSSSEAATRLTLLEKPRALQELHFVNETGAAMSLADFRGRVVLLNIWATWCVPCRKEMPTLDRLQADLGGAQFEVVVLSIDRGGADAVQSFYKEVGVHHLGVYVDTSGKVANDLNIIGLPTTLLIDREGRELARLIGPAVWDSPEIVSVIKGVIGAPPAAQGELELSPQRSTAHSDAAPTPRLAHGDVRPSVSSDRLTF
jgi:thiol-disulfide isomerase/thioredoxin